MARSRFVQRALAAPLGVALSLALVGGVIAQDAPEDINTGDGAPNDSSGEVVDVVEVAVPTISTNADGAVVESTSGENPVAEGGGGTLVYGDITGGVPPVPIVNSPAPAQPGATPPEPEPAPSEPVPAPPAPAPSGAPPVNPPATSATDQDGDNLNDADEPALGLDPSNIDTDGDFIDDGYELNGLGTSPTNPDTDGDGSLDGEEVYGTFTDPLVAGGGATGPDIAAAPVAPAAAPAAAPAPLSIPGATGPISAAEGEVSTLGPGVGEAAPGTINGSPVAPQVAPVAEPLATAPFTATTTCADYGSWYDAQTGYEGAGRLSAPSDLIDSVDPDYDGIACEELMA